MGSQLYQTRYLSGRHREPLLAALQGAIIIPSAFRWYRPLRRTQPPANGFEPSGFTLCRRSKEPHPNEILEPEGTKNLVG